MRDAPQTVEFRLDFGIETKGRYAPHPAALSCGNRFLPRGKGARHSGTLNPFGSFGSRLKGAARPDDTACCEVLVCISIFVNCGSLLVLQLVPKAKKPLKRPPGTEHWPKFRTLLEYLEPPKFSLGSSGSPIRPHGRPEGGGPYAKVAKV